MTPEQEAEFAGIVAEYEAGRARLVPHEDVPAALEAIARTRRGDRATARLLYPGRRARRFSRM